MLKQNISYSMLTNLSRLLFGLFIFIFLSRLLSLSDFGQYVYFIIISGYFSIFTDFGFNLSILNDVPKHPKKVKNFFYEILYSKTILVIISFLVIFVFFGTLNELYILILFIIGAIIQSYASLIINIFKAFNQFDKELSYILITNLTMIIFIVIYKDNLSLYFLGYLLIVSRLLGFLYLIWMFYKKFTAYEVIESLNLSIKVLKDNFKYAIHMIIGGLFLSIDIPIMKELLTYEDVAIYSAGMKLFVALVIIADVLNASFMPKLSEYIKKDQHFFEQLTKKLIFILFILGFLLANIVYWFGSNVILMLYGDNYSELYKLLPYFAVGLFIRYLSFAYGTLVTLADKQHIRAILMAIVFFVHVGLNLILQSYLGIVGAIIALCISFSILLFANMYFVYRYYNHIFLNFKVWKLTI